MKGTIIHNPVGGVFAAIILHILGDKGGLDAL